MALEWPGLNHMSPPGDGGGGESSPSKSFLSRAQKKSRHDDQKKEWVLGGKSKSVAQFTRRNGIRTG